MAKWKLIQCNATTWIQDKSGYYTLINWVDEYNIRLDVMFIDNTPAVSFVGDSESVRKQFSRYAEEHCWNMSYEHLTYIGKELYRAEVEGPSYLQL